jgi:sulfide:quinone oxidoreductase
LTSPHIVILGAGFGGLELSSRLSDALGDDANITLIDRSGAFVFGFLKFELMLGRQTRDQIEMHYRDIVKPGVNFRQEEITAIDPAARRVTTDKGSYDADVLVVGLGADYNLGAVPGFVEGGREFYSVDGAEQLREVLPSFKGGNVVICVLAEPFKCPPAPVEAAMLLDDWFDERGIRADVNISVVTPWGVPIPPAPEANEAILARFRERNINFMAKTKVVALEPDRKIARLRDGGEIPYDLFLGIPVHRVPHVVEASGLAVDGWIPVDKRNLATRFPGVYAIGDVTSAPVPKAGIFAESAGRAVAEHLLAEIRNAGTPRPYDGAGACYIEFGDDTVGRVDVDFLTGPTVTAPFTPPSLEVAGEKKQFARDRRARWFGG